MDRHDLFVDTDHHDYHLKAGAAGIDQGEDVTALLPVADFPDYVFSGTRDGVPIHQGSGFDIGAHERPADINGALLLFLR